MRGSTSESREHQRGLVRLQGERGLDQLQARAKPLRRFSPNIYASLQVRRSFSGSWSRISRRLQRSDSPARAGRCILGAENNTASNSLREEYVPFERFSTARKCGET